MATNSNSSNGEQALNVQDVTRDLARELRLRPNAAGSACSSPPTRTASQEKSAIILAIQNCLNNKTSPRNANLSASFGRGCRVPRNFHGLSPSQSASSDSSMSGGGSGFISITSRDMEKTNLATGSSINSFNVAASARPLPPLGSTAGRGRNVHFGGERTPNSPISTLTIGRGKNALSASAAIGCATKTKPKRKRLSKKPPTKIIEATKDQFRATVQLLTGCNPLPTTQVAVDNPLPTAQVAVDNPLPTAQVVRPTPERPQLNAVRIDVDKDNQSPPARPDSSSPAMTSSVPCPSPTVADRAPENTYSFRDSSSSGSSSGRSSLNYTMGYEPDAFPPFLEYHQQHSNPPEDSGLPDEYDYADEVPMHYSSHNRRANAATPTRSSFQVAASQVSESNRKEDISSGHILSCSNNDSRSGSGMPDHFPQLSPSEGYERKNRPRETMGGGFEMEDYYPELYPLDPSSIFYLADSFLV